MSAARTKFLETGAYEFLADQLEETISSLHPKILLDLGCGEGYYTRRLARAVPEIYGIDLSKPSIAHAASKDKKTQYIVGSIFELPFSNRSMDVLTSIFTPIPAEEANRVLKKDGVLITVTPGKNHHRELKEALYDKVRLNDKMKVPEGFVLENREELTRTVHIDDPWTLLEMTPYRYKTAPERLKKIQEKTEGMDVTFDFVISIWRKKNETEH